MNDRIIIKCHDCGKNDTVGLKYYKSKPKDYIWRCKTCRVEYHKNWYKRKPLEEREKCHEKMSNSAKKKIQNYSEEEKKQISEEQSKKMKKYWASLSKEEYLNKCNIAQRNWDNLSEEKRNLHKKHVSESQHLVWTRLSNEAYQYRCHLNSLAAKKQWENVSELEMDNIRKKASERFKRWWNDLSPEELNQWSKKKAAGIYKKYIENILYPNKNESAVIEYFNLMKIPWIRLYQNKIIHQDFNKLFPNNPVTGAKNVEPLHIWDFMIPISNNKMILVDVDGSVHDPSKTQGIITNHLNGKKYKLCDSQAFNDSQRPYQTDGHPAYIIRVWDDKLTLDSIVLKLESKEIITFRTLLDLLKSEFLSDKEIKEIKNLK